MAQDKSLLLNVARNLRYRTLAPMIGESVTISNRTQIATETAAFVARFVDGCSFASPEQRFLDGQIAKYGLLDLRFAAPSTMLDTDATVGVPLLRELGFVDSDWQRLATKLGADADVCLEGLREDIAKSATHLMLYLESSNPKVSEMSTMDRMTRLRDPSMICFPIEFTVIDACVANATSVWMTKHLYL